MAIDRRTFLANTSRGIMAGGIAAGLGQVQEALAQDKSLPSIEWQMTTSWAPGLDIFLGGAQLIAERVGQMTDHKFKIHVLPAGEGVSQLGVLEAVQAGIVQLGHTAGGYWYFRENPITVFSTVLPFGLTAQQQNAWLYEGGGLELMQAAYAEKFNLLLFPAGNIGTQMGWFNKEINTLADFEGLKIQMGGLGAQVMTRLGAEVQVLPGHLLVQALRAGELDAVSWSAPYDDEKLGLHHAARYYYYPAWWETGASAELQINIAAWQELPATYQAILEAATYEANVRITARYNVKNPETLRRIFSEADVALRPFPWTVMKGAEAAAFELYADIAASDADFAIIFQAWLAFRDAIQAWHGLAETTYLIYHAWHSN